MKSLIFFSFLIITFPALSFAQEQFTLLPVPKCSDHLASNASDAEVIAAFECRTAWILIQGYNDSKGDVNTALNECAYVLHKMLGKPGQPGEADIKACKTEASKLPFTQNMQMSDLDQQMPSHCGAPNMLAIEKYQIPRVLDLSADAAQITNISMLSDIPRVPLMPAFAGHPARFLLQCPVKVSWSNGNIEYMYYAEWTDEYSQIKVYYGKTPPSDSLYAN